jgi:hypothetical protein
MARRSYVTGEGLSPLPVTVIITADRTGRIDVIARGPLKGKAGLLTLIDAAREIAEQMNDDGGGE